MTTKVSPKRNIAKAVTWRLVGTVDTFFISWFVTGLPLSGLKMGIGDTLTKMLIYYVHERLWLRISFKRFPKLQDSHTRHIAKTISWRIIGTIDTIVLAWILLGNPLAGLKIGLIEIVTKLLLYYLHERVWHKSNYGITEVSSLEEIEENEPEKHH